MCSTPSGIRGMFTNDDLDDVPEGTSAQRLPASEACSLFAYWTNHSGSTSVLNAFRHQRHVHFLHTGQIIPALPQCSTPSGIRGMFTQRGMWWIEWKPWSAQRLPASEACSPRRYIPPITKSRVLNAFRHQRHVHFITENGAIYTFTCSTPSGIRGMFT